MNEIDQTWLIKTDTDIVMETEIVASIYWPNFVLEFDETDERLPPKQKDFFIYRNQNVRDRINEEGRITDHSSKSFLHFLVQGYSHLDERLVLTVVANKEGTGVMDMLNALKENLDAQEA